MLPVFAYWNGVESLYDQRFLQNWSDAFGNFTIYNQDDVVNILNMHWPDYADIFIDLKIPAAQADICRLAMLYVHGGLYTDCHIGFNDAAAVQSFYQDAHAHGVVLVDNAYGRDARPDGRPMLINSFLFSQPKHPLIGDALSLALRNLAEHRIREAVGSHEYNIWLMCGPQVLNEAAFGSFDQFGEFPVLKEIYKDDVRIVQEEYLPVSRDMYRSQSLKGRHWSERQVKERLYHSSDRRGAG